MKQPSKSVRARDGRRVYVSGSNSRNDSDGPTLIAIVRTPGKPPYDYGERTFRGKIFLDAWLGRAELRKLRDTINQILGES